MSSRVSRLLTVLAPGLLVAATGVGAGDLATASFSGSQLGTAVLWAVVVGGVFKFVLNEGLARWQLATGTTFLAGAVTHLGPAVAWVFIPYLILWSYFVGAALMGACGVALHALMPVMEAPTAKVVFGLAASAAGLLLARRGSFQLFERTMGTLIAVMFVTVLLTAAALWPGWPAVLSGLFVPRIPEAQGEGLAWTVGLIGGVGGTVTILCYGYWIAEKGRRGLSFLRTCRLDLAVGYGATILFGIAMVIIGSTITTEGGGADLLVRLADSLELRLGPIARVVFLIGALAAVFSSLLGVWQAVPYLAADLWTRMRRIQYSDLRTTRAYRWYLWGLATVPAFGLLTPFRQAQLLYAVVGAAFLPLLAVALLLLNGRGALVGESRNGPLAVSGLAVTLLFFLWVAARSL
ncbi:MAG: Nramp family divalent metal transporter [Rhodothermales bacterium]|nr:Nramp family divalent metal transporter [Rhodothermales bacterium]MBO6780689.1 Nramp family divalent metal transporter [Rhodothermales bacterium]